MRELEENHCYEEYNKHVYQGGENKDIEVVNDLNQSSRQLMIRPRLERDEGYKAVDWMTLDLFINLQVRYCSVVETDFPLRDSSYIIFTFILLQGPFFIKVSMICLIDNFRSTFQ